MSLLDTGKSPSDLGIKDESFTEDDFGRVIANLSKFGEENDEHSIKSLSPQTEKKNGNEKITDNSLSCGSGIRNTPKKKQDVPDERSHFETPKKSNQRRNIFQTPSKDTDSSSDWSPAIKIRSRKVAQRKRILSSEDEEDDGGPSKKSLKVAPQGDAEKTVVGENSSDIDEALELKAGKIKMNAKNVKTVIRQVLTNPKVLNMFKDVLEVETEDSPKKNTQADSDELDYQPKMTRAKVKDFLERISVASPSKKPPGPSILEVDFAEEEEDDEYDPAKDECRESDEDETESMMSSRISDFGSPCPLTPNTPRQVFDNRSAGLSPYVPYEPLVTLVNTPPSQNVNTSGDPNISGQGFTDSVNNIALRTRSKLPLHSTSITDIENAFVAPDITPDMYYTNDDADWNQFLSTLYKQPDEAGTDDDAEANDPEFDYIAEAELEDEEELEEDVVDEFQFHRPNRITKKELNTLMDEVDELFGDEILPFQAMSEPHTLLMQQDFTLKNDQGDIFKTPQVPPLSLKTQEQVQQPDYLDFDVHAHNSFQAEQDFQNQDSSIPQAECIVTDFQVELIKDQMRKHVQLLAQSFVICGMNTQEAGVSEFLLNELDYFCRQSYAGEKSLFNVCNLDPALAFIRNPVVQQVEDGNSINKKKKGRVHFQVTAAQKKAMYESPAFLYPHLLPTFISVRETTKNMPFLPSEDNLIALGLEQFRNCKNVRVSQLIQKYLVYREDEKKILNRIYWLTKCKTDDNVVKFVHNNRRLPDDFPKPVVTEFLPVAPQHQNHSLLPTWCKRNVNKSSSESEGAETLSQYKSHTESIGASEYDSLPDLDQPSLEQVTPSSSLMPGTSTPQRGRLPFIQSNAFKSSYSSQSRSCVIQWPTEGSSAQSSITVPVLPKELKCQEGQIVVFPRSSCSSLPQSGIFYPFENSNPPSESVSPIPNQGPLTRSKSRVQRSSVAIQYGRQAVKRSEGASSNKGFNTVTNFEAPSPDLLTRTMISCGIGEDMSNLSPITLDALDAPSTISTKCGKVNPTVRNLRKAFDAIDDIGSQISQSLDFVGNKTRYFENSGSIQEEKIASDDRSDGSSTAHKDTSVISMPSISSTVKSPMRDVLSESRLKIKSSASGNISALSLNSLDSIPLSSKSNAKSRESNVCLSNLETGVSFENIKVESSKKNGSFSAVACNKGLNKNKYSSTNNVGENSSFQSASMTMNVLLPLQKNTLFDETVGYEQTLDGKQEDEVPPGSEQSDFTDSVTINNNLSSQLSSINPTTSKNNVSTCVSVTNSKEMNVMNKSCTAALSNKDSSDYKEFQEISQKTEEVEDNPQEKFSKDEGISGTCVEVLKSDSIEDHVKSPNRSSGEVPKADIIEDHVITRDIYCEEFPEIDTVDNHEVSPDISTVEVSPKPDTIEDPVKAPSFTSLEVLKTDTPGNQAMSPDIMDEEAEVDQAEVDELMASIVTIRYDSQKHRCDGEDFTDSKSQLDSNENSSVSKGEPLHTDFITDYFQRAKDLLQKNFPRFEKLLFLLRHLNVDHCNAVELYVDLVMMLHEHMHLVDDFAGLLVSFQAVLCRCSISSHEHQKLHEYLTKLKFNSSGSITTLKKWLSITNQAQGNDILLKKQLMELLHSTPGLVEKCCQYFLSKPTLISGISVQGGNSDRVKLRSPRRKDCIEIDIKKRADEKHQSKRKGIPTTARVCSDKPVVQEMALAGNGSQSIRLAHSMEEREKCDKSSPKPKSYNLNLNKRNQLRENKREKAVQGNKILRSSPRRKKRKSKTEKARDKDVIFNNDASIALENCTPSIEISTALSPSNQRQVQEIAISTSSLVSSSSTFIRCTQSTPVISTSLKSSSLLIASDSSYIPSKSGCTSQGQSQTTTEVPKGIAATTQQLPQLVTSKRAAETLDSPSLPQISDQKDSKHKVLNSAAVGTISATPTSLTTTVCAGKDVNRNVSSTTVVPLPSAVTGTTVATSLPPVPLFQPPVLGIRNFPTPQTGFAPTQSVITDKFQPGFSPIVPSPGIRIPVLVYLQPQKLTNSKITNNSASPEDNSQKSCEVLSSKGSRSKKNSSKRKVTKALGGKERKQKTKINSQSCSSSPQMSQQDNSSSSSAQMSKQDDSSSSSGITEVTQFEASKTGNVSAPLDKIDLNDNETAPDIEHISLQKVIQQNPTNKKLCPEINGCHPRTTSNNGSDIKKHEKNDKSQSFSGKNNGVLPISNSGDFSVSKPIQCETPKIQINQNQSDAGPSTETAISANSILQQLLINSNMGPPFSNTGNCGHSVHPDLNPSETLSHMSPLKSSLRKPSEVFQNYLGTMAGGTVEESMDPQFLQRIAHLLTSPNKHATDSVSKFDLLAFIESSQFACKDLATSSGFSRAATNFFNQTSSSTTGPLGFTQAFKEHGLSRSESQEGNETESNDTCQRGINGNSEPQTEIAQGVDDYQVSDLIKSKEEPKTGDGMDEGNATASQWDGPLEDLSESVWTEEWDEKILQAVAATEEVTESAMEKLQLQIPIKSITELTSRANELLKMMQDMEIDEDQEDR